MAGTLCPEKRCDGHLILKRDDPQVTSAKLWNRSPEAEPVVFLRLRTQRILDHGDAPLLLQIGPFTEYRMRRFYRLTTRSRGGLDRVNANRGEPRAAL